MTKKQISETKQHKDLYLKITVIHHLVNFQIFSITEVDVSPSEEITVPKLSLNPLPPERLIRSSEEREKSSEPPDENEDSETGSYNYVFYVQ